MWKVKLIDMYLIDLFYNFLIYSFIGWIYESVYVSIRKKHFVNRGFLNGPIIPVYGCGATLVFLFLWRFKGNHVLVFLGGMLVTTILEYVTSYFMEKFFHARWWDYSEFKIHIHGRVCLFASVVWGFFSLLVINVIQPFVIHVIDLLKQPYNEYIAYALFTILCLDVIVTIIYTLRLNNLLSELKHIKVELSNYMLKIKLFESREELKSKLAGYKFTEILENIKKVLEENKEKLIESHRKRKSFRWRKYRKSIEGRVKGYIYQFQERVNNTSFIQRRLLKAFPQLNFAKKEDVLKDLRDKLEKHRKKKKR